MPKTPNEIKKGLECCNRTFDACHDCPYDTYDEGWGCTVEKNADALAYILQLEAERDAAVADIRYAASVYIGECNTCKNGEVCAACKRQDACDECPNSKCMCSGCGAGRSNWQWRGVQKED
jgi:hypothetical protein